MINTLKNNRIKGNKNHVTNTVTINNYYNNEQEIKELRLAIQLLTRQVELLSIGARHPINIHNSNIVKDIKASNTNDIY